MGIQNHQAVLRSLRTPSLTTTCSLGLLSMVLLTRSIGNQTEALLSLYQNFEFLTEI